jgi:hypothetical protein
LATFVPNAYTVLHAKLQDKWQCDHHTGSFCYKEPEKTAHIRLSFGDLGIWATAIINEAATISCPPRTSEYEKILHPKRKQAETPPPQIIEIHEDQIQANKPIIHYHMLPPTISATAPTQEEPTPKKKRCRSTILTIQTSSIPGFEVPEYNTKGLAAYLLWCTEEHKDCEFIDAYESLSVQKIGIDIIPGVTAMDLHKGCNILLGTATRIIRCYPKWLSERKSVVINLNMTVSELIPSDLWSYDLPSNFKNFFR